MTQEIRAAFDRLPWSIQRLALLSLRINATPGSVDELSLGQSRIGGDPDLPPGFEWPRYDGLGLSFIAQFDLEELANQPTVLPLPKLGNLFFFYDSEQRSWGFDPKDHGSAVVALSWTDVVACPPLDPWRCRRAGQV